MWLAVFIGCSSERPQTQTSATTHSVDETPNRNAVTLQPSTSPESLRDNFKLAFENGDIGGIESLIHWGKATEEDRKLFLKLRIGSREAGTYTLSEMSIREVDPGEFDSGVHTTSLEPTKAFDYTATSPDGSSYSKVSVPVAKIGDEYKIGALVSKQ